MVAEPQAEETQFDDTEMVAALEAAPDVARTARYHCVLAFVRHAADPVPLIAAGAWEGRITTTPSGAGGFGYDPLFVLPCGRTAAELPDEEKHAQSHRGAALRAFLGHGRRYR